MAELAYDLPKSIAVVCRASGTVSVKSGNDERASHAVVCQYTSRIPTRSSRRASTVLDRPAGRHESRRPGPERPEFLSLLEDAVPHWTRRHPVKPGTTGWAQVRVGYTSDAVSALDKLSYDLYCLKHRGLLLDLGIVAKTVWIVFARSGAK